MSLEPPTHLDDTDPDPGDPSVGAPVTGPDDLDREAADLGAVIGSPLSRALRLGALIALIVVLGVFQGMSMLIVVAAIVIMIFMHELGHFIMARRAGMLVTEFFIGFGPRIWSFQRGETEYGLKAIPAGAYVRIIGMSNLEEVDPALESRTYRQKTFGQRLGVAVAGSTMHFLMALVLLLVQFALIGGPDGDRWQVANVSEGSAAAAAGLQLDDEILEIDGRPVGSFEDFRDVLADAGTGTSELTVLRAGDELTLPVALSSRMKLVGTVGEDLDVVDNGSAIIVGEPFPGGVADDAGVVGGAELVSINGTPVTSLAQVADLGPAGDDGVIVLGTRAEDGRVSSHEVDLGREVAATTPAPFLGVGAGSVLVTQPLPEAAVSSVETFGEMSWASIVGVGKFLNPANMASFVSDAVSGPDADKTDTATEAASTPSGNENRPLSIIGVAMLGSDLSSQNLANLVGFLAQLNIFLGIFNLFPLLPFDGGHVVVAFYEKAQELRRRSTQRYIADISRMTPIAFGVIAVLGVIGLLAMFMDITRGVSF